MKNILYISFIAIPLFFAFTSKDDCKEEKEKLEATITSLEKELQNAQQEISNQQEENNRLFKEIEQLEQSNTTLNDQLANCGSIND